MSTLVASEITQRFGSELALDALDLVLDKGETIEFTTDEGTWMSLDVSPDGKLIVFDLLGDLYTLPKSLESMLSASEMSFERALDSSATRRACIPLFRP